jgi:hypothetical protein
MERALLAEGYAELHLIDDAARAGQVRLPENRART